MSGEQDVRELLGVAAEGAGRSRTSTEEVYAKAARVRWRRRLVVSGAVAAVVAAGAVAVPALAGDEGGTKGASVAAPSPPGGSEKAKGLAGLLPPGVGEIEEVDLAGRALAAGPGQAGQWGRRGPLDSSYAVRKDGGVGLVDINLMSRSDVEEKLVDGSAEGDLCAPDRADASVRKECREEELGDGRVLTTWRARAHAPADGGPRWGPTLVGWLRLKDGGVLMLQDSTGFTGKGSLGRPMASVPLSRDELRALIVRPELLPEKPGK
ncbi:hypothetical protein [Streptomyces sp. NPDC050504]|uniref:hypothetical protein n=1 Tax=Streptomyces sp. NPDC050504 TaxID=3365618 RepID=UPI00379C1EB7